MKKAIILILICISIFSFAGCKKDGIMQDKKEGSFNDAEQVAVEPTFHVKSSTPKKVCGICGVRDDSLMDYYRKFDSIGIINLNTMEVIDSGVRCYDEDTGKEIFEQTGIEIRTGKFKEGDCEYSTESMVGRGISEIELSCDSNNTVSWGRLSKQVCQGCINKVVKMYSEYTEDSNDEEGRDICLIDFKTLEVFSLEKIYLSYSIRDYFVKIDQEKGKTEIIIFYAPMRNK